MNETEDKNYIRMTETPVWKLILKLAIPTTISMLITNIYNTADTFFVSKIGVSASAATGIVFALMALLQAFGFMFGHGAGSNVSRLLGAKDAETAGDYASTSFFLATGLGIVIGALGIAFINPFMRLLGSTETILPYARIYGTCILAAAPAMIVGCVLNNILRYEGRATYAMIGLTTGGILNMILDPILIFLCNMGMLGAGLATALSQYVSVIILLLPFLRGKTSSKISFAHFAKGVKRTGDILTTGLPNLLRQGLTSIATTVLNTKAAMFGDAAVAAFSIASRCAALLFAVSIGIAQGFQPVAAFNYGAKKNRRVRNAMLFTCGTAMSLMILFCGVCSFKAPGIISLFRDETEVVSIGAETLRYMCVGLILLPLSSVGSMLFQSTGKKGKAALLAALQSGLLFIPLLFIMPYFFGLKGLEMSQAAAYIIAGLISLPLILQFLRELS